MKVEKLAKYGEKGQNCYPLSPRHRVVLRRRRLSLGWADQTLGVSRIRDGGVGTPVVAPPPLRPTARE